VALTRYKTRPKTVEAIQWFPTTKLAGLAGNLEMQVEVMRPKIIWSRDYQLYYLSGGTVNRPTFWLNKDTKEQLPFMFWSVKSGARGEYSDRPELVKQYYEAAGWTRQTDTYAILGRDANRQTIKTKDWLWRYINEDTWNVCTDAEMKDQFERA